MGLEPPAQSLGHSAGDGAPSLPPPLSLLETLQAGRSQGEGPACLHLRGPAELRVREADPALPPSSIKRTILRGPGTRGRGSPPPARTLSWPSPSASTSGFAGIGSEKA